MKKFLTLALVGAVILVIFVVTPVFSGVGSRYSLKLEEIEGRGTLVSLSTNDENRVGLVLRDADQKRNLEALLVEEAPDRAKMRLIRPAQAVPDHALVTEFRAFHSNCFIFFGFFNP